MAAITLMRRRWLRWAVSGLIVLAVLLGRVTPAVGAVAIGAPSASSGTGVSSLTWAHTTAAGSDRMLVVRIANSNTNVTVSNVTYGGVALTQLQTAIRTAGTANPRASIWYLLAPAVGTANVVVTLSGNAPVVANAVSLTGVAQSAPFGTPVTAVGPNNTMSTTVASATGELVIDMVVAQGGAGAATVGAGQTGTSSTTGGTANDVLGMFSSEAGGASVAMTWTTAASTPWVTLAVAVKASTGFTVSGTVFEDLQYGGGAGRSMAASNGAGVTGATVELYDSAGNFLRSTSTAAGGGYSFADVSAGSYFVRVVSNSVRSTRTGSTASVLGVMTYRTNASSGSASAVTDFVGGTNPAQTEPGAASSGAVFNTTSFVYSAGLTGTAQAVAPLTVGSANIAGIDFGFNFDTVVSVVNAGQGSLRQAMINANTLGGDSTLAQSGRSAGVENLVFMIPNGTAAAGLRSSLTAFSGGVATISPTSALPTITTPMVIDASTQPGWSSAPIVVLAGGSAGASSSGFYLQGATGVTVRGFVIRSFRADGVYVLGGSGNTIAGNYIGTNPAGSAAQRNAGNGITIEDAANVTIGGTSASARNVLSGNGGYGIFALGAGSTGLAVRGNYIGTDASGNLNLENTFGGIGMIDIVGAAIGGTSVGHRNVISGNLNATNAADGIWISGGSGNLIQGNYIGMGADGLNPLGNYNAGISIQDSSNNLVGGTSAAAGNLFTYNLVGVLIDTTTTSVGNAVLGNSMVDNLDLGIDLSASSGAGADGVTPNDAGDGDSGPNNLQNYPVLSAAAVSGSQVSVSGSLNSQANGYYRIELFASAAAHATGYGEGARYLGFVNVATNGSGNGSFSTTLTASVAAGEVVTATATQSNSGYSTFTNTSEFSAAITVASANFVVNSNGDQPDSSIGNGSCATAGGVCTLRAAIAEVNAMAASGLTPTIRFALPSCPGAGCVITPASALPTITRAMVIDGSTQAGWSSAPIVELAGGSAGAGISGLVVQGVTGATIRSLVIRNFNGSGISVVNGGSHTIAGNYIGLSAAGTAAQANGSRGINLSGASGVTIGGTAAADRNVISGNGSEGIRLDGAATTGAVIVGNHIGTNAAGDAAIANATNGIAITSTAGGSHVIGGTTAAARNVISGNANGGLYVFGSSSGSNTIQGNYIGSNAAGTAALGNGNNYYGLSLAGAGSNQIGGTAAGAGNLISGHAGSSGGGVWLQSNGNTLQGNRIGTNAAGTAGLGNGGIGVAIHGSGVVNNTIGGTAAGAGNVVAYNGGKGVSIIAPSGTGNRVSRNAIYGNTVRGIDIAADGRTPNNGSKDTTLGNADMDAPVITAATLNGSTLTVAGYVGSAAGQTVFANSTVEIFKALSDGSGYGQGQTWLGSLTTDANGNFSGSFATSGLASGDVLTTTATDSANNTSEFGPNSSALQRRFVVNSNLDEADNNLGDGSCLTASGVCTLRAAIAEINAMSAQAVTPQITFALPSCPGAGCTITPASALPIVSRPMVIDATTQAGWTSAPIVQLAGGSAGAGVSGLRLYGITGVTVRGFVIRNFSGNGIDIADGGAHTIAGNYLGIDAAGTTAAPNALQGLNLYQSANNAIGGLAATDRNIISGNSTNGVVVTGNGATGNVFRNNYIGTNASGNAAVRNGSHGLYISTPSNTVGGTAAGARNTLSGNQVHGLVLDAGANGTVVQNNYVGLSAAGNALVGNQGMGMQVLSSNNQIGGTDSAAMNVISGNTSYGLALGSAASSNTVQGNRIGISPGGTTASPNGLGVNVQGPGNLIGGPAAGAGNLISSNTSHGIELAVGADYTVVQGNRIGTNIGGTSAFPNGGNGVQVSSANNQIGGATAGAGNTISGNYGQGIVLDGGSNLVQGNVIGLNSPGTSALGNSGHGILVGASSNNAIGGSTALARNVISANGQGGIFIGSTAGGGHVIQGNYIGTRADGASALGNAGFFGIEVYGAGGNQIGGTVAGAGNLISGQSGSSKGGLYLASNNNTVQGNKIGSNAAGTAGLPNNGPGIAIWVAGSTGNTIGGTAAGAGNLIAYNAQPGVAVTGANSTANRLQRNAIFSNTGIGIDIAAGGRTANNGSKDNALGNAGMDTPVITAATLSGSTLTVAGYVGSAAGQTAFANSTVEIFKALADSSGYGQGQTWLGSLTTDANGNFSGSFGFTPGDFSSGNLLTATATDTANNTSEFGPNFSAVLLRFVVNSNLDEPDNSLGDGNCLTASGVCTLRAAIAEINALPVQALTPQISFALPSCPGSGCVITPASALPDVSRAMVIDAQTQPGWVQAPLVELLGNNASNAHGLSLLAAGSTVRGLSIGNFGQNGAYAGIYIAAGTANLQGNYIGLAADGSTGRRNGASYAATGGVLVNGGTGSMIGGTTPAERNVISGNGGSGVRIAAGSATVRGNYIGSNAAGDWGLANGTTGVYVGSSGNTIGGLSAQAGNLISGNAQQGVLIEGAGNTVTANVIGLNAAGTASLANSSGVHVNNAASNTIGGSVAGAGNLISGNGDAGIVVTGSGATGTLIQGNHIGTNAAGTAARANGQVGIRLQGVGAGTVVGPANLISGNASVGLLMAADNVTVQGNLIGTNASGTAALPNGWTGVQIDSGAGHLIGGSVPTAGNLISGNGGAGIFNYGGAQTIQGNLIGTTGDGMTALGNTGYFGIELYGSGGSVVGGTTANAGNLISGQSGNGKGGIFIASNGNTIQGNKIGTNATGLAGLPNAGPGIGIAYTSNILNNTIGGTADGAGNTIAYNGQQGVLIASGNSTGNRILRNAIFANSGLQIDIAGGGVTANNGSKDSSLANAEMDTPVFTSARAVGASLTVAGYVGSAAGQSLFGGARVEVFASSNDASGYGGGRAYLGALTTDASGNFSGTLSLPVAALALGTRLTATATDGAGNTSEFGPNFTGLIVDLLVTSQLDEADTAIGDGLCQTASGVCTLRAALAELNAQASLPAVPRVAFAIPGCTSGTQAACTIAPASNLPFVTRPMVIDASTQPGYAGAPLIGLSGATAYAGSREALRLDVGSDGSTVRGLRFAGWAAIGDYALKLESSGSHTVAGNWFGLAADGSSSAGTANRFGIFARTSGSNTVIGGTTALDRNLIANSGYIGLQVLGNTLSLTVIGNWFGLQADGATAAANQTGILNHGGVLTIGGASAGQGNTFGYSSTQHIQVDTASGTRPTASATIRGNLLGFTASGTALPSSSTNALSFVGTTAASVVGGTGAGEANVITGATSRGVSLTDNARNVAISGNRIDGNGLLGIDLAADGVTANDGAMNSGTANEGMDFPVLTSAGYDAATRVLSVTGYIGTGTGQAAFAGARVELFAADGDGSGYGEGRDYLGALTADASGRLSGSLTVPAQVNLAVGNPLTATATDAAGNTSEFGPNFTVTTPAALLPSRFNAFETGTANGALSGFIKTMTAGVPRTLAFIAIDGSGSALASSFAGSVSVQWMDARDNAGALDAGGCRSSWVAQGSAGSLSFANGTPRMTTSLTPPAVGREWRLRFTHTAGNGTVVAACSTDNFAVKPASLAVTALGSATSSTAGVGNGARSLDNGNAAGGVVHRAGRPFALRAQGRDANGALAGGYDGIATLALVGCALPSSGCTLGALQHNGGTPVLTAAGGVLASDALTYSEVGAITVRLSDTSFADVDAGDSTPAERLIQSGDLTVGRFVPDRYAVTVTSAGVLATANASCTASGAGYTFFGQAFGWASAPQVTVTALNAQGVVTTNWSGSLQRLDPVAHVTQAMTVSGTASSLSQTHGSASLTDLGGGSARLAMQAAASFALARDLGTPLPSVSPVFGWAAAIVDSSEAGVAGNGSITGTATQPVVAFSGGGLFHTGRLALSPGHGDARRGVRLLVELQRYGSAGWVTMTEDRGCVSVSPSQVMVANPQGVFGTDGVCAAPVQAGITLRGGRAWMTLPATPRQAPGRLVASLNLGAASTGLACQAAGVTMPGQPMNLPYLASTWGGAGTPTANPLAALTWGRPNRDVVLTRERF